MTITTTLTDRYVDAALRRVPGRQRPDIALIWLVSSDKVLNPAFVEAARWSPNVTRWIDVGLIISAALTLVQTVTEGIGRARRR